MGIRPWKRFVVSGSIDFDLPVWSATVWHSERGATNPWCRVFNVADEKAAVKKAAELFVADGLSAITIYSIEVAPLIPIKEGGENGGSGPVT
jgi:hypothetical protein